MEFWFIKVGVVLEGDSWKECVVFFWLVCIFEEMNIFLNIRLLIFLVF